MIAFLQLCRQSLISPCYKILQRSSERHFLSCLNLRDWNVFQFCLKELPWTTLLVFRSKWSTVIARTTWARTVRLHLRKTPVFAHLSPYLSVSHSRISFFSECHICSFGASLAGNPKGMPWRAVGSFLWWSKKVKPCRRLSRGECPQTSHSLERRVLMDVLGWRSQLSYFMTGISEGCHMRRCHIHTLRQKKALNNWKLSQWLPPSWTGDW